MSKTFNTPGKSHCLYCGSDCVNDMLTISYIAEIFGCGTVVENGKWDPSLECTENFRRSKETKA